jgi:hypothetical protein
MPLCGTLAAFDAVELFLYDIDKRGSKHKIMCKVYTKIEAVNYLGSGNMVSWQLQGIFDIFLIRLCLHKNSDGTAPLPKATF